jgi:FtsP/CotA-like multicopper oxidase with cupredoxin domain
MMVSSYSDGIKLVDGDNNDNIDWGSPDPDNSVSTNPYTFFFVPANQIRVRIRAINLDDNEFFMLTIL